MNNSLLGAVRCLCLSPSLASTHSLTRNTLSLCCPPYENQKCLQTLPNVPWQKSWSHPSWEPVGLEHTMNAEVTLRGPFRSFLSVFDRLPPANSDITALISTLDSHEEVNTQQATQSLFLHHASSRGCTGVSPLTVEITDENHHVERSKLKATY